MFSYRLWLTLGMVLWNAAPLPAQCVSQRVVRRAAVRQRVVQQQFVEVPFAQAVSVPVAEAAPFFYSYNYAPQQQYQAQQSDDIDALIERLTPLIAARLGLQQPQVQPQSNPKWDRGTEAPQWQTQQDEQLPYKSMESPPQPQAPSDNWNGRSVPESVVAAKCAGCHGHGEQSKPMALAKIDLSDMGTLTDSERIVALRVARSRRMPPHPNTPLTNQELDQIVDEFTQELLTPRGDP